MKIYKHGGYNYCYRPGDTDLSAIKFSHPTAYTPKPTDIVLDVGAHIGAYAIKISKYVSKVVAVEPFKENIDILEKNLALNNIENIEVIQIALSNYTGEGQFYIKKSKQGGSLTKIGNEISTVKVVSFDDFMKNREFDFAKFNCEGGEYEIIMDSKPENIKKIKRYSIAFHNDKAIKYTHKDIYKRLKSIGYNAYMFDTEKHRGYINCYKL